MQVQLYDTTLRDGSQGEGVNFSVQDKLLITKMLDEVGFDFIEGGFAGSNEKDSEYFQRIAEVELKHAQICAFGMTRRRGVSAAEDPGMQALLATRAPVCTVVGKTWDLHVTEVLRVSLEENLAMIADSVEFLVKSGRRVVYDAEHFFDGFANNPEYALQTVQAAQNAGAEIIVCCDTNGGSLPERITATIDAVAPQLTIPLGIHCHNDCDVGANSLAAVDHGAVQVQGTINGIGERCGNADLISIAANLALKKKNCEVLQHGVGPGHLTELSRYVYELANMNFRGNQAFVGRSAFAHKGGMHVHAVNRVSKSYEHIDPEAVGNERRVLVSELSGRSNIVAKTTQYKLDHDQDLMRQILDRVVELENEGYQFEASEASFDLLVKKCAGTYEPKFQRLQYRVNVETAGQAEPLTEATVKLRVNGNGHVEHVVAEGDGPVNALDNALRKALIPSHPNLASMHLVDYKVRVINSTEGTAARVRVVIESADQHDVWSTVGVSENIIEASWLALVDAVEYKLYKDEGELGG
ncbi:MAG: citramalate synthase [Planctomycetota bacterium]|nr:MAG: citramalate synthase [Planctomycetota bacterium]